MDKAYEEKYHLAEEDNWWFCARRDMICNILKKIPRSAKILDVGCSGGPLILLLKKKGYSHVAGVDISKKAIELAKKRGLKDIFVADGKKLPFKEAEFDVVIASDVLEHILDDRESLVEWKRVLKPGGKLIVFVPAFQFLWSSHDNSNLHYRRYSRKELISKFRLAGFSIKRSSYWNFVLFFPVTLLRLAQKRTDRATQKKDQLYHVEPWMNKLLLGLLRLENYLLRKINFPVGVSVFVIGEKKSS